MLGLTSQAAVLHAVALPFVMQGVQPHCSMVVIASVISHELMTGRVDHWLSGGVGAAQVSQSPSCQAGSLLVAAPAEE